MISAISPLEGTAMFRLGAECLFFADGRKIFPCLPSPLRKDQEPYGSGGSTRAEA